MADLVWKLSPPGRSRVGLLSPESYLRHLDERKSLHGRDSLVRLGTDTKNLSLDPKPKASDRTMFEYYTRTSKEQPEDRTSVHVTKEFKEPLDQLAKVLDEIRKIQAEKDYLTETKIPRLNRRLDELAEREAFYLDSQLPIYTSNMIRKMVDTIHDKEQQKSAESSKPSNAAKKHQKTSEEYHGYVHALKRMGRDKFSKEHGLDPKYYYKLKDISEQIEARNAAAHETETEFAKLLVANKSRRAELYYYWKDLFPFCYGGKTVEQVAGVSEEEDDADGIDEAGAGEVTDG